MLKIISLIINFALARIKPQKQNIPTGPDDVTTKWLTDILISKDLIPKDVFVEHLTLDQLEGGVHSKVYRANIEYKKIVQRVGGHKQPIVAAFDPDLEINPELRSSANAIDIEDEGPPSLVLPKCPKSLVIKITSVTMSPWGKFMCLLKKELGYVKDRMTINAKSYETETNFYNEYAFKTISINTPKPFFVFEDYYNLRFVIVLEDVSPNQERGEPNGFSAEHGKILLRNLAKLHASFWESKKLSTMKLWDRGGYWIGDKEGAREKRSIATSWSNTLKSFREHLNMPDVDQKELDSLGDVLQKNLPLIVQSTSSKTRTLVHGDYKISNLFIHNRTQFVNTIDWQWMGCGLNSTDVMYFLFTSLRIEDLQSEKIRNELIRYYYDSLVEFGVSAQKYTLEQLLSEVQMSLLDFFVFCVTSKYEHMSIRDVERYAEKRKDGLHLRSLKHIELLIREALKASKLLTQENSNGAINGHTKSD